jgi:hypothetical protein
MPHLYDTYLGRCKGKTKGGEPCQHYTVLANGYCRQHQDGAPKGFDPEIKARLMGKINRSIARFERRMAKRRRLAAKAPGGGDAA